MKFTTIKFTFFLIAVSTAITLNAQITTPRVPSPGATVSQKIGISEVTVNYSRPSTRDREIWGSLVPYGWNVQGFGLGNSAPWRAGANENTTITFSHAAKLEGKDVPAGTYGLFLVINEDNTGEVILSKDIQSWGSFFYDPANDQLRANITVEDVGHKETLQYEFVDVTKSAAKLILKWAKKQFNINLGFDTDQIVLDNAKNQLKGTVGFSWLGFSSAANYAMQNNVELDQAIVWIDQAIAQNRSFTTLRIKSGILTKQGKDKEADQIMKGAIATATEPELNVYGYQLMGQGKTKEAVEMFLLNTERFPSSANAWDSLGEGYFNNGDKKKAITSFKKSLSLNPPANVKANSEKFLKQMDAM